MNEIKLQLYMLMVVFVCGIEGSQINGQIQSRVIWSSSLKSFTILVTTLANNHLSVGVKHGFREDPKSK